MGNKLRMLVTLAIFMLLFGCAPRHDQQINVVSAQPTDQTIVISEPAATPTDSPTPPTATPIPTPTPAPYEASKGVYTIAWFSDTQHYSALFPNTFYVMTEFFRDNAEPMNLGYIVFTGDFVHNNDDEQQWIVADEAMRSIENIPNGVLAGNHDMEPSTGGYELYYKYFGEHRYDDKPYYIKSFEDNRGHYDLLTLGNTDYLFVYMSHSPSTAAIKWVKEVVDEYPQRVAILCLHDYFTSEGELSEDGQRWYDRVVSTCHNLYMVLCGHKYGIYCTPAYFDDNGDGTSERTVYQMMLNYQAAGDYGGNGYLRLMQVDEAAGTIKMVTYSPLTDDYNMFDDGLELDARYWMDSSAEDFTIDIPWR